MTDEQFIILLTIYFHEKQPFGTPIGKSVEIAKAYIHVIQDHLKRS